MMQPEDQVAGIMRLIGQRERGFWLGRWAMIAVGSALSFVGPLMMAMIVWFSALMFGRWWPWWTTFWISAAVMIPLEFWYAARGSERMLMEAAQSGSTSAAEGLYALSAVGGVLGDVARLGAVMASPRAAAAGFQELFLFGPRQMVAALRRMRVAAKLGSARRERAAEILAELAVKDRGVEISRVIRAGEKTGELLPELALLMFFDWIGVSEDAKRAWALTDAKKLLVAG